MANGDVVLKQDYSSPRWTNEILDCSMPMTFDTYSRCAYNCQYCFSFFQKSHSCAGYLHGDIRSVKPQRVIQIFEAALNGAELKGEFRQFISYIQSRRIMQWGGLADEFDEYERRFGITLELLKYFDSIDYPLSFSTKAAWWTEDERYMSLFARHSHNWHVKVSIITNDDVRARLMEKGCPNSTERLSAIKRLADIGIHVTLRLRPYIIGLSDDFDPLIRRAAAAGADSVTTEFFCMDARADENLKKRYAEMSRIIGYDIHKFYMAHSEQSGFKRLNKAIKAPIIARMRDLAHSLGMRFHVSDMFCRECNDSFNCCGVPPEWNNSSRGHFGSAIEIAKHKGRVTWSDVSADAEFLLGGFPYKEAAGYNYNNSRTRALFLFSTMADYVHFSWNDTTRGTSLTRAYGGVLTPDGADEKGDVIYKYTPKSLKE